MFRTGIDIVDIDKFRKTQKRGGQSFLIRIFSEAEIEGKSNESLAGLFAAKEAVMKAAGLKAGSWLNITIDRDKVGRPVVELTPGAIDDKLKNIEVSISHDGNYAVAIAIVELE